MERQREDARVAELESEIQRLQKKLGQAEKVKRTLMERVERSLGAVGSSYHLFERSILLEQEIKQRTTALEDANEALRREIADRLRAERDLEVSRDDALRAREEAVRANRAKSAFLATMSHEIRTPMNGVIGMTELALDTELTAFQRDCLECVRASANALLDLINDILDFSKIEAGHLELESIGFSLRDCLSEALRTLVPRASAKGLELVCEVRPDVPDALIGDPCRLRQILLNLVGNAVKFSETGDIVVLVENGSEAGKKAKLQFAVRDQGIGISPELKSQIFQAFVQADGSTTRKYGGTGLGLSISSRLVEAMGGSLSVESAPGLGSTFRFGIDCGIAEAAPRSSAAVEVSALSGRPALVVDDNETNRRILVEMLDGWGMIPTAVADGMSALRELQRADGAGAPFQIVITDGNMPGIDGFQLIELMRANPRHQGIPALLLTSMGREETTRSHQLAISAYLQKPVKQSDLLQVIRRTFGEAEAAARPRPSHSGRQVVRGTARPLRVLLVEDEVVNQKVATAILTRCGHQVSLASNGREAVTMAGAGGYDVILMDVQMPEMDGLEATREIRRREPPGTRVPVVAMTAYAMAGDRERCLDAGMDDYLSKPIAPDALIGLLERWGAQSLRTTTTVMSSV